MFFSLFGLVEVIFRLFIKMTLKKIFKVKGHIHVPNIDLWCLECLFGLSDLFLRSFPFLRKDLTVFLLIIIIILFFFRRKFQHSLRHTAKMFCLWYRYPKCKWGLRASNRKLFLYGVISPMSKKLVYATLPEPYEIATKFLSQIVP